jgi:hypothetical protein
MCPEEAQIRAGHVYIRHDPARSTVASGCAWATTHDARRGRAKLFGRRSGRYRCSDTLDVLPPMKRAQPRSRERHATPNTCNEWTPLRVELHGKNAGESSRHED